jgi:two-component system NarL family response regulator
MTIRVALVEDQRLVREILEAQLAREADLEIVGATGRGRDAIEMARRVRPDVLIVDLGLPDIDGLEVARVVRAQNPAILLIALSVDTRPERVRRLMEAGAHGYVVKSGALDGLLQAVHAVVRGTTYVSPELSDAHAAGIGELGLGRREREVLALIAEGRRSPQIAARLGISPATVEAHRRNIMRKLNLHSVAELTKFALRAGLTSL